MHNELIRRWGLLQSTIEQPVFQLFDHTHPLKFYIGKSVNSNLFLMLKMKFRPPKIKSMRAIKIEIYSQGDDDWSLLLKLENLELEPMFALLCADLITFSKSDNSDEKDAINSILRRLSYWRLLLEREVFNLLSEGAIRGLFGELFFLSKLIKKNDLSSSLKAWVGPLNASQDFQTDDCAWEVKTIRPTADYVQISSEWQLDISKLPVHLVIIVLFEVNKTDNVISFSLNGLVESIRSILMDDIEASDLFEQKLTAVGYSPRSEYDDFKYKIKDILTYEVVDGFPCVSQKKLAKGIVNVKYDLEISELEKYRIDSI